MSRAEVFGLRKRTNTDDSSERRATLKQEQRVGVQAFCETEMTTTERTVLSQQSDLERLVLRTQPQTGAFDLERLRTFPEDKWFAPVGDAFFSADRLASNGAIVKMSVPLTNDGQSFGLTHYFRYCEDLFYDGFQFMEATND